MSLLPQPTVAPEEPVRQIQIIFNAYFIQINDWCGYFIRHPFCLVLAHGIGSQLDDKRDWRMIPELDQWILMPTFEHLAEYKNDGCFWLKKWQASGIPRVRPTLS